LVNDTTRLLGLDGLLAMLAVRVELDAPAVAAAAATRNGDYATG
jgi:hypothetical protein